MNESVTIVGAGLVGSLLSLRLAQLGYDVSVFESRPDMRKHEISAGRSINLALANRGLRPLEKAGLGEKVKALIIPMKGRMLHDEHNETSFHAYGQTDEEVIYSISRADLNCLLMDEAEATGKVKIHFDAPCYEIDAEEQCLKFDNKNIKSHVFKQVIGTDGANSAVRVAIENIKHFSHQHQPLEHSYKELCIPPHPSQKWAIEKEALHIWPRDTFMLIALPNIDGSFTVTLFLANHGEYSFDSLSDHNKVQAFFKEFFPDALDLLPNLCDEFFKNPTGKLGTVRCAHWHYEDKFLLLGDAAHAIVPFHGQGMNCGFEDVDFFINTLEKEKDWSKVFELTALERQPNANAIADLALENYIEMRSSVREDKFLLKKEIGFALENKYPGRYIPRYSQVMFHHTPYTKAQQDGEKQKVLLTELAESISTIDEVDWQLADRLMDSYFPA